MKLIYSILVFCGIFFTGCITPLTPYNLLVRWSSDEPLKERLEKSRKLIEERKRQAYSYTLAEKAEIFEAEFNYFRLPAPYDSFLMRNISPGQEIVGLLGFQSEVLAMLAFKYAATKNPSIQKEANEILGLFLSLDDQFGKQGQLSDGVIISRKPLKKSEGATRPLKFIGRSQQDYIYLSDDAHGNNISAHFFGAYHAYRFFDDPAVKAKSAEIIRRLICHLLDEEFLLKRLDGEPSTHGDLSGREYWGFSKNALLARLMFLEVARAVLEEGVSSADKELLLRIRKDLNQLASDGVPQSIERMSPHIANFWFSTPSSNDRVFRNFYLLVLASGNTDRGRHYWKALKYQWQENLRQEYNSFLGFLYFSVVLDNQRSFQDHLAKSATLDYLKSAPLDRDNREVLNSFFEGEDSISINRFSRIYKFKFEPKNKTPLPLYRRGIRRNEWSADSYRLNENEGGDGSVLNSPLDFLTAYYAGLAFGFISVEEQRIDKNKVEQYLKEKLPIFEKTRGSLRI